MKDLHSHILFGIDDGAKNIEDSLELIKLLKDNGTTDIILTPHYINNTKYNCNNFKKIELFNELKKLVKQNNIDINLYLGNEIMSDYNIIKNINNGNIMTLNNSRYLLIELPLNNVIEDFDIVIKDLLNNGYIPILAHPERYKFVKENINNLDYYLKMGVLLQGNYESLFNKYGYHSKKILKKLIKTNKISFLGSDIHNKKYSINTKNVYKKIKKLNKNEEYINNIISNNFDKVINNLLIGG